MTDTSADSFDLVTNQPIVIDNVWTASLPFFFLLLPHAVDAVTI